MKDPYQLNRNTYNSLAKAYEDKFMDWDGYHTSYDQFLECLAPGEVNMLEIGCGPGNVSYYLRKKRPNLSIYGIDIAPNMIALAKKNNPEARYDVMDCRNIGDIKTQFDAIMCGFCTPYIAKDAVSQLIKDAASLLKPKGLFYLSTMEGAYQNSGIQRSPNHSNEVHIYYYDARFLKKLLVENGFEIHQEARQQYKEEGHLPAVDLFLFAYKK